MTDVVDAELNITPQKGDLEVDGTVESSDVGARNVFNHRLNHPIVYHEGRRDYVVIYLIQDLYVHPRVMWRSAEERERCFHGHLLL